MTIETLRTTRSTLMKRLREAKAANETDVRYNTSASYIRGLEVEIERADSYIKMMEKPRLKEKHMSLVIENRLKILLWVAYCVVICIVTIDLLTAIASG